MNERVLASVAPWLEVLAQQSGLNLFTIVRDLEYIVTLHKALHKDNPKMAEAYSALMRIVDIVSKAEEGK